MADLDDFAEFFIQLPEDPEQAFVVFHKRCCDDLESRSNEESGAHYERIFMERMVTFDDVYGLNIFSFWSELPKASDNDAVFWEHYREFRSIARKAAIKIQLEHARRLAAVPDAVVRLDGNARKAIHALLDAVRAELNQLDLSEDKRAALFKRLNAFAHEVDQNLTRTEAIFRLARDIGQLSKDAGDHLKPVTERIDRIIDMVERAQSWAESLPPWGKRKEIPAPPKRIEQQPQAEPTIDDDIPF